MIRFLKKYGIAVTLIAFFSSIGFAYVGNSARNIVFMDFWRNSVNLIEAVMENKCNFQMFWDGSFGQRNPLQLMLVAFDIRFLNLNCLWESYGGIVVLSITAGLISKYWNRLISSFQGKKYYVAQFLFVLILLSLYNLNQWEILSLQFSFAFMLRLFVYIFVFFQLNNALQQKDWNTNRFLISGIVAAIAICLLSQLYFPAMVLSVLITLLFAFKVKKGETKSKIQCAIIFFIPCLLAIIIYFMNLSGGGMGGNMSLFMQMLGNGTFFLGVFYMLVGSVFPQTTIQNMSAAEIAVCGIILSIAIIGAAIIYFYSRMYQITYFPMLLAGYGLISIPIIIYGRASRFDLFYLTSSRYVCETTLIWVGCSIIYIYTFISFSRKVETCLTICYMLMLSILHIRADMIEFSIAPYRGAYKDNLLQILINEDIAQVDDSTINLFQSSPDLVREGVILMQRYNLNVFNDESMLVEPGTDLTSAANKKNMYEDGWVGPNGSLNIRVGNSGILHIETYDPFWERHPDGKCTVYVNGSEVAVLSVQELINQDISVPSNQIIRVLFDCDYYEFEQSPGERLLCFVLLKLESTD